MTTYYEKGDVHFGIPLDLIYCADAGYFTITLRVSVPQTTM